MKFVNSGDDPRLEIEVGDLISFSNDDEDLFILIHDEPVLVAGELEGSDYPYLIVDLAKGTIFDAFPTIEDVREIFFLIAKNKDLALHY